VSWSFNFPGLLIWAGILGLILYKLKSLKGLILISLLMVVYHFVIIVETQLWALDYKWDYNSKSFYD